MIYPRFLENYRLFWWSIGVTPYIFSKYFEKIVKAGLCPARGFTDTFPVIRRVEQSPTPTKITALFETRRLFLFFDYLK